MQARYRLYRRSNRSHGTYYAQDSTTGARESLGTKNKAEALKLLQAKNEAQIQPVLSRELAKVYMHAQVKSPSAPSATTSKNASKTSPRASKTPTSAG